MTRLLEEAVTAVRQMPPDEQDALANFMLDIVRDHAVAPLPEEHLTSIEEGLAEADRGAFASEAEVAEALGRVGR